MSAADDSATGKPVPSTGSSSDLHDFSGLLVLIGAGKMGSALLAGWMERGLNPAMIVVIEPALSPEMAALARRGVRLNPDVEGLGPVAVVIVAVKPQNAVDVMPAVAMMTSASTLVISIMAGRTLRFLAAALHEPCALVRAMPNTPASIGHGITVAVPFAASSPQRRLADRLLSAGGAVEWIEDETLMDAVTAVSGSGPAYVFLLAEALAQAGAAAGLPPPLAERLARETIAGAGELLRRSAVDAVELRENVTSPGGTTAAALKVLMGSDGFGFLMTKAVRAATQRSRELAG